jgi:hypothetical protein
VTLYLPVGFGTRYPVVVLASKRRRIERIDCMSTSVVVPQLQCRGDPGVRGRIRLEKLAKQLTSVVSYSHRKKVLNVMTRARNRERDSMHGWVIIRISPTGVVLVEY